jgi:hypothetical protein
MRDMEERGPPTLADAIHKMAAQAACWGLVLAAGATEFEQLLPFAIAAPFVGAYCLWATVRLINRRDDPRHAKPPPDAPSGSS